MKKFLGLAALAASIGLAPVASATPTIQIAVYDGLTQIGLSPVITTGTYTLATTDANFPSISVTALGIPLLPSPQLATTTLDVQSNGPSTLTVLVTQTDVTSATNLLSTFAFNALLGTASTAVLTNYIDAGNVAFATTTQIATAVLNPVVQAVGPIMSGLPPALFSETEKYVITFGAGVQAISASSQIAAPEPISLAILGSGLIGLGLVRRKRA
jgi:hypothetical protein